MSYTGSDLMSFGKRAAVELFTNKTPLVKTITKIASDNDLNAEQVLRVCQNANQASQLFVYNDTRRNNTEEFENVKCAEVLSNLNTTTKVACITSSDYNSTPAEIMSAASNSVVKIASTLNPTIGLNEYQLKEKVIILEKMASKLEIAEEQCKDDLKYEMMKHAGAIDDLANIIVQAKRKGIEIAEMMRAAIASVMPGEKDEAKKAMDEAIQKADQHEPGILSRIWGGITGVFKGAEDLSSTKVMDKLAEMPGNPKMINSNSQVFGTLKAVISANAKIRTRDEMGRDIHSAYVITKTNIKNLNEELKGRFNA